MRKLTDLLETTEVGNNDFFDVSQLLQDGRYISRKVKFNTFKNIIKSETLVDVEKLIDLLCECITTTTTTITGDGESTTTTTTNTSTTSTTSTTTTSTTTPTYPEIVQEKDTIYYCKYECDNVKTLNEQICCSIRGKAQSLYKLAENKFKYV